MNSWHERVVADPAICHGKPCIKGTRIFVSIILDNLAEGNSEAQILADYPGLTHEDILAAVGYAADLARERIVAYPAGVGS
jgi:uncharacterized protein (DUF433 family)